MNLAAYWASNISFDIFKAMIPCVLSIAFLYAFSLEKDNVFILFLLYPFAIVPFTCVTSFFFSKESTAQPVTMVIHFFICGMGAIAVSLLRIFESTRSVGDALYWAFRVLPSYPLTNGYMFISNQSTY